MYDEIDFCGKFFVDIRFNKDRGTFNQTFVLKMMKVLVK